MVLDGIKLKQATVPIFPDDTVKSLTDEDNYESDTTFALAEVAKAVSTSKGLVSVEGTQDKVVCFSWDLANKSKIRAMIAPKV